MATIMKQGPFGIEAFPKSINDLFDSFLQDANSHVRDAAILPKTDIAETEQAYELQVTLPGIAKEDISIEINENKLLIKGERKIKTDIEGKKYHKVESVYGTFERSFVLPKNSQVNEISAKNENGILTVVIPKVEVVNTVKKVEVK